MSFLKIENIINDIKIVIFILLGVLIMALIFSIMRLVKHCRLYLKNKSIFQYNQLNHELTKQLSINEKIEVTNSILNMINSLIEIECQVTLKTFVTLNQKYDYPKLSDDITLISNNVYNGLDKSIFENPDILLTGEYLMKYITQQTSVILLGAVIKFNNEYINQA